MVLLQAGAHALDVELHGPRGGPPVLLLHGFPDGPAIWERQAAALAAAGCARRGPAPARAARPRAADVLTPHAAAAAHARLAACPREGMGAPWPYKHPPPSPRCRVVVPSMLGYGRSAAPASPAAYALRGVAAGLAGLLDSLGLPAAAVVGHDWGAAAAWRLALDFPARVARLAVVSVGHPACGAAAGGLEQRRVRLQDARRATNGPCPVGGPRPPPARAACGQQLRVADRVRMAAGRSGGARPPLAPRPPPPPRPPSAGGTCS